MKSHVISSVGLRHRVRNGVTIVETLVVLGIIGLLAGITVPAIMSARLAARRMECSSNLRQLGTAIANYESLYGVYPLGWTHKYQLLPFIDQSALFLQPLTDGPYGDPFVHLAKWSVPLYHCPNENAPRVYSAGFGIEVASTNYAACYGTGIQRDGYNGFFNLGPVSTGGFVHSADITDGLSNTAAMSEILHGDPSFERLRTIWQTPTSLTLPGELEQFASLCESIPPDARTYGWRGQPMTRGLPWYNGDSGKGMYNHLLGPNRPSCTNGTSPPHGAYSAASMHRGGVLVLFGDGRVVFVSNSVDAKEWREMGSRVRQAVQ